MCAIMLPNLSIEFNLIDSNGYDNFDEQREIDTLLDLCKNG